MSVPMMLADWALPASLNLIAYHLPLIFTNFSLIFHLHFSLTAFTISHFLPIDCYISFTPSPNLPPHWDQVFCLHLLILVHSDILICCCPFSFSWSTLISISLPSKTFPWTIINLFSYPYLQKIFYYYVLSCIFIESPLPLPLLFSLASLLAVGWAICLVALLALHCPLLCCIGPSSHHHLHTSQQSNPSSLLTHFYRSKQQDLPFSSPFLQKGNLRWAR